MTFYIMTLPALYLIHIQGRFRSYGYFYLLNKPVDLIVILLTGNVISIKNALNTAQKQ